MALPHQGLLAPARSGGITRLAPRFAGASVGLSALDLDHRILHVALGILENEISYAARGETLGRTIGFLIHFTDEHFGREERLMEEICFDGLAAHKQSHDIMRAWMEASLPEIGERRNAHYDDDALAYLYDWWDGHSIREDKGYADFIFHRLDEAKRIVDSLPRADLPSFLASSAISGF